ncbi:MAG: HvfC/BufC family peptide modification chaperone [Gammaproteobacteria bacterium]
MQSLHTLQHQFWQQLRNKNQALDHTLCISHTERLSAERRLNIYKQTTRSAHTNALSNSYICCERILGEKYFKKIASEYFLHQPSHSQNLNNYGNNFPKFISRYIENHTELADFDYLKDLAILERNIELSYFSKDDQAFDFTRINALKPQAHKNIIFSLSHALSVMYSEFPVYEIWLTNRTLNSNSIQAIEEPQYLCVYREDFKPKIEKISYNYYWAISHIKKGIHLLGIESLAKEQGFEASLQPIIPNLIQRKWIQGFSLRNE